MDKSAALSCNNDQCLFQPVSQHEVEGLDGYNAALTGDKSATLGINCGMSTGRNGVVICLQGNCIDRADTAGCNGKGWTEGKSYTLNTIDRHAVVYAVENHPQDSRVSVNEEGIVQTLSGKMGTGGGNTPLVLAVGIGRDAYNSGKNAKFGMSVEEELQPMLTAKGPGAVAAVDFRNYTEDTDINGTLQAKSNGGTSYNLNNCVRVRFIVRRLTPLECERLQGFPDGWTDIGEWTDTKGKIHKECTDSARYKALGNSIALPFWRFLAKRISAQYLHNVTMASLFDGIGGFPLVWEQINGTGSCVWASEIE